MINLTSAHLLRVITASASAIDVSASWVDLSTGGATTVTPGVTIRPQVTTATTTTAVPAPSAGAFRNVKGLTLSNVSVGASCLVRVEMFDGSNAAEIARAVLAPGERLTCDENGDWTHSQQASNTRRQPAGTLFYFAGANAPAGSLKANGDVVSRATYADLFAAIGTIYGAGDGSTTFKLPDLRAEFLRGLDDGRGVDTSRVLGSSQADAIKTHAHGIGVQGGIGTTKVDPGSTWGFGKSGTPGQGHSTLDEGGSETRPRNVAALACIAF